MEIAIPLFALGSMFILKNQEKNKEPVGYEGLTNMTDTRNPLPSINPPIAAVNYPITQNVSVMNANQYDNANQVTDKYFDPARFAQVQETGRASSYGVGGGVQQTYSLDGKPIDKDNFKHNNMVPYFGAKIRGATADGNVNESRLDNMQGSGSQQFSKKEQAPMFQPQAGYQYAFGAPNMSDFMMSRVNPAMRMANVKPWEEQQVAPGLNQGFGTQGSNGFNSGLEARDMWLPKTVNELRVDNNPKMTFSLDGHQGPGDAYVKNSPSQQTQGKVEKYLPDKYFVSGPDRWFTTTGLEKAQTARGEIILQDVNRLSTTAEYYGLGGAKQADATYAKGEYEMPKRPVLAVSDLPTPGFTGAGQPTVADYGVQGYNSLPNNRSTTRHDLPVGGLKGLVSAIVSPLMDVLRPSRKENVLESVRGGTGNVQTQVANGQVYNPADRTRTTIREMTEGKLGYDHLGIDKQITGGNAYLVSTQTPVMMQRDTTNVNYTGTGGPSGSYNVPKSYEAEYQQRNNVNKTSPNHPNQGGTQIFNSTYNIQVDKVDSDRNNNRWWVPSAGNSAGITSTPSQQLTGATHVESPSFTYDDARMNQERLNPDLLNAFKSNP